MKNYKVLMVLSFTIFAVFLSGACTQTEVIKKESVEEEKKIEDKSDSLVGKTAPKFELATMDSKNVTLESIKGNPSVIIFWASYCGKCKKETPQINELAKTYMPKGVNVIGVNYGETVEKLKEGVKSFDIKYTVAKDVEKQVSESFKVKGTPTIVFLNKNGIVKYVGNKLPEDYAKKLDGMIS